MLTDVPCCCVACGLMYSARERMISADPFKKAPAEKFREIENRRFEGMDCQGESCRSREYRLLLGPLFVPRD